MILYDYLTEPGAMARLSALLAERYKSIPEHEIDRLTGLYGRGLGIRGHTNPLTGLPQVDLDEDGCLVVVWGDEVFDRIHPSLLISGDSPN